MRDRLGQLHQNQTGPGDFAEVEPDGLSENETATGSDQDLNRVLTEAQQIHLEIQQMQNDISMLKEVNYQTLNRTSPAAVTKQTAGEIGGNIKRRGEAVLQQLHMMNNLRQDLEAQRGPNDPSVRIARTQYHRLTNALREVMFSYNDAEMSHREACKRHIQRQMEVVGQEVSDKDLEEMMTGEELCVFSIHVTGHTTRSALAQIESRHNELRELEKRMEGIQDLFLDVAVLVAEQGATAENIEKHVEDTDLIVHGGVIELEKATASDKNNPCKKLFCGCFPCYYT